MKRSFVALTCVLAACSSTIDTDRDTVDTGTFGTTVLTLACKRIAYLEEVAARDRGERDTVDVRGDTYRDVCRLGLAPPASAPQPLLALQAKRGQLVAAVDAVFPPEYLPDLQTFLTNADFLALYDDGTTLHSIDKLTELLAIMSDDPELSPPFLASLERLNHRLGYAPIENGLGTVRAVVNYPGLHDFLLTVTDAITEGGAARKEFDNFVLALSVALRHAEPAAELDDPERTGALALDLLLTERPELGLGRPLPIVRRDTRGVATVKLMEGAVPAPFADMDADDRADVDALGRFVDPNGLVIDAPAPFSLAAGDEDTPWPYRDEEGRALLEDGGPLVYEYVDLDRTVFAALVRDSVRLLDPAEGTALDMLRGASALVGPRVMQTRTYGDEVLEYRGYDTAGSPLLDMVYALLVLGTDPAIYDTLELSRTLFRDHEAEAARLIEAFIRTARMADAFPDAKLEPGSPLYDDLMPVLIEILQTPGLAEDLMRALEQPESAELPLRFAEHMSHRDLITIDPATQQLVGSAQTPVDRAATDSGANRSLMQRLLHLIADSNGAQLCNKQDAVVRDPFLGFVIATYDECEMLQIDNLAVFYVQSIAYAKDGSGNVIYDDVHGELKPRPKARFPFEFNNFLIESIVDDDLLEEEAGIEGFRFNPTPQALNRSLFLQPMPAFLADAMDPARCTDGDRFIDAHPGTLMVWEQNGFYDQVRPIAQAFADHNAEHLFVDILTVLHDHYPSPDSTDHQTTNPGGKGYAQSSNLASYEPLLVAILEDRTLFDALVFTAPVLNNLNANGRNAVDILTGTARFILYPRPGLAKRDGSTTTETADGRAVDTLSPWYVLADAFADKRAMLDAAGSEGVAWRSAVSNVTDVLLRGDSVVGIGYRFRNPRFRGVTLALLDYAEGRLAAHDLAGDRADWLLQDLPARTEELVTGPVFAGAADFVLSLQADPAAREQLEALAAYLVDEVAHDEAFLLSLTATADVLQFVLDDADIVPIAHVIGAALDPQRGILDAHLTFIKAARHSDQGQALVRLLQNLFVSHREGHTAVGDLIDGIATVHRVNPYDDLPEPYTAADYQSAFRGVAAFLGEERRGLRKFIQIIQGRNL